MYVCIRISSTNNVGAVTLKPSIT